MLWECRGGTPPVVAISRVPGRDHTLWEQRYCTPWLVCTLGLDPRPLPDLMSILLFPPGHTRGPGHTPGTSLGLLGSGFGTWLSSEKIHIPCPFS
jgi:hypothetical protein